jgi:hypothetical protein
MKNFKTKKSGYLFYFIIGIFILVAPKSVWAANFCVATADELKNALTAASNNGEEDFIKVRQGTYFGNFIYASTEPYGVSIEGGYTLNCTSRLVNPENTVLDSGGSGPVLVLSSPNATAHFSASGLTIQNGNVTGTDGGGLYISTKGGIVEITKNRILNNSVRQSTPPNLYVSGGGAFISIAGSVAGNVIMTDNLISGNNGQGGGGFAITGDSSSSARVGSVTFKNNIISNNTALDAGGGYIETVNVLVENNTIDNNSSTRWTGGITVGGQSLIVNGNMISNNKGGGGGIGGIQIAAQGNASVNGNLIIMNRAESGVEGYGSGGGFIITVGAGLVTLTNNVISDNYSATNAGGIMIHKANEGTISLTNNTITNNTAKMIGGGLYERLAFENGVSNIYNNIILDNNAPTGKDLVLENDLEGNYLPFPVNLFWNNFDQSSSGTDIHIPFPIDPSNLNNEDPMFVDPVNGDFHLQANSPCINAGDNDAPNLPTTDADGLSRIVGGIVDIGAYEYQNVVAPIQVDIDIRPWSKRNPINYKGHGILPVAILSTEGFDAPTQVDQSSLTFGATGDEKSLAFCKRRPKDVSRDGSKDDLVCHFYIEVAGFKCGDTEGILKGKTVSGIPIEGEDLVRIVHCK